MGYVPTAPRLNLDRFGLPRDYATYMWVVYRQHVVDNSPERRAFLIGGGAGYAIPNTFMDVTADSQATVHKLAYFRNATALNAGLDRRHAPRGLRRG